MGGLARRVGLALVLLCLAACQTTPSAGGLGVVQVVALPQARAALQRWASLDESFAVHEQAIREGRLLNVRCQVPDAAAHAGFRTWQGYALAVQRGVAQPGDVVTLLAGDAEAVQHHVYRLGRLVKDWQHLPLLARAGTSHAADASDLVCQFDSQGRPAAAAVDIPVQAWVWDFSQAERARHRQFSDADFAAGSVAVGSCALRDIAGEVYHQPLWLFRVPEGLALHLGDVVEVEFGETESGGGVGRLSRMTRPLGTRQDFPGGPSTAIFCR